MTPAEIIAQTVKSRTPLNKPTFKCRFGLDWAHIEDSNSSDIEPFHENKPFSKDMLEEVKLVHLNNKNGSNFFVCLFKALLKY